MACSFYDHSLTYILSMCEFYICILWLIKFSWKKNTSVPPKRTVIVKQNVFKQPKKKKCTIFEGIQFRMTTYILSETAPAKENGQVYLTY